MCQFKNIIFDLDGTLSDPEAGIRNSFKYAFHKLNIQFDIESRFNEIVGPPLHQIFEDVLGWDEAKSETGVKYFREYYGEKGVYENILYPGIKELLSELDARGRKLFVATSKYEKYAHKVLEYHNISHYFRDVAGASYKGPGADKAHLVRRITDQIPTEEHKSTAMVGDKRYDMLAAEECGITPVGVLYGFGSEEELKSAGAISTVQTVLELSDLLNSRYV